MADLRLGNVAKFDLSNAWLMKYLKNLYGLSPNDVVIDAAHSRKESEGAA